MKHKFDEYGFNIEPNDIYGMDISREIRNENTLIQKGCWIMIIKTVPVAKNARPQLYGIYWAVPYICQKQVDIKDEHHTTYSNTKIKTTIGVDEYGRQCATIYTPEEVRIFPDEYSILTPERVEDYRNEGWYLNNTNAKIKENPLTLELITKGRSLVEEEREIIWALMLEGLTERQACEEYFLTHHVEHDNTNICYLPTVKILTSLETIFGKR